MQVSSTAQTAPYPQPLYQGQYPQPPYQGQYPQPPYQGQYPQPPYQGQYPQPPYQGQYPQPPYQGQYQALPNNGADSLAGCLDQLTAPTTVSGRPKVREDGKTEYWYSGWGQDKEKVAGSECWGAPGFFSTDSVCWSNTITLRMKQSKALELCRPQGR